MRRLICAFVVRIWQQVFSWHGSYMDVICLACHQLTCQQVHVIESEVLDYVVSNLAYWLEKGGYPSICFLKIFFISFQDQNRQTSSTNQEVVYRTSANQNEDYNDIATETRNPSEGLKRPYTSLIDKEIARERSLSRSSRGSLGSRSRSRSLSPNDGRPRFSYPQKLGGIGPLHEPVASSTHKSLEIRAQMSNNLDPDSPRSSIRGSSVRAQSPFEVERQAKGHVAFNERTETSEGAKQHSPNLKKGEIFKDPEYVNYYKQLTSSGRKKELLKQRQVLLDEQERLRLILKEQEDQLKRKQLEYEKRQQLQKERMEFYEKGDKFPPLKLNFDADSEKGYGEEREEEGPGIVLRRIEREADEKVRRSIENGEEMVTGRDTPQERVQIGMMFSVVSSVDKVSHFMRKASCVFCDLLNVQKCSLVRTIFTWASSNNIFYNCFFYLSRDMTKPTMWLCAQRRLRSAWASAQSDQSLRCPHEESLGL